MFEDIREDTSEKFRELNVWLQGIDDQDALSPITKGLFFVYVYGIYEETIRTVVGRTIDELNRSEVTMDQCIWELYALILSEQYDGLYGVGNERKWEKRWEISRILKDNQKLHIARDIMPTDGRNFRYRQLESIAKTFGLSEQILPRNELGGYIQEMVNNRNYIAHGNLLPREVGSSYNLEDLKLRSDSISESCMYFIAVYEKYVSEEKFLRAQ